ncbi:MAG: hypothetical protein LBU32_14435 [Clostridiales bacterium]|jgi:hypothetical protein|nr:hypothetical protein [Clostridiales bacterium]
MDNYELAKIKKRINSLIRRKLLSGKRIILFGASAASKEVKRILLDNGLRPDAVIDNDKRKLGKYCFGLTVQTPEAVIEPFDDSTSILIYSASYYKEITLQLNKMGYETDKHVFCLNLKGDERASLFLYTLGRMSRGWLAYLRLTLKYSRNHVLFLAPYAGTGDIYLSGLFLEQYLKSKNIKEYIFVVVSGACRKTSEIFGIENIEVLSSTIVDDIINCNRAFSLGWRIVILNDGWMNERTQWIRGYKGLSFDRMFRYFVFELDESVSYQLPLYLNSQREGLILLEKYRLLPGRTVVLSPYSNTLLELPDDFWKRTAERLKGLGYSVCTNSSGANEPAIEDTTLVYFPLGQAVDFMNAAGFFIGVRSGLCDIISASSCKKIVLYEKDGVFFRGSPFEYFSLKKIGLCIDALELEYSRDTESACLEMMLGLF